VRRRVLVGASCTGERVPSKRRTATGESFRIVRGVCYSATVGKKTAAFLAITIATVGCVSKPRTIVGTWEYSDWLTPMTWTYRFNANGTYIQDLHMDDAYGGKQWIRSEGTYTYTAQDLILMKKSITSETVGVRMQNRGQRRRSKSYLRNDGMQCSRALII